MRCYTVFLAAASTLLVVAPVVRAQAAHEHTPIPAEQLAEAEDLYRRAEALLGTCDRNQWEAAADLFVESARLRECHDPKIYDGLREAAEIAHYFDDTGKAHRLMKEAAEHAMHVGDVENAVEAFVKAVYLAAELGDRDRAVTYLARAEDLSQSPLLGTSRARLQELIAETLGKGSGGR